MALEATTEETLNDEELMLLFYAGNELYCSPCEPILEVIPKVYLKTPPTASEYFAGLLNFGGRPVPVIDFCQLITGRPAVDSMHSRIIIFTHPHQKEDPSLLGVVAEKVTEISGLPPSAFLQTGMLLHNYPFLGGLLSTTEATVQMVLIEKLFELIQEGTHV